LTVRFNNSLEYKIPECRDNEGHPIYVKVDPVTALSFITVSNQTLIIYPNLWKQQTVHDLKIVLTDGNANSVNYEFKLTVTNSAHNFKDKLKNVKMLLNEELEYEFPIVEDLEFNPVLF